MFDEVYRDKSLIVLKKKRQRVAKKAVTTTSDPPANTDIRTEVVNTPVVESELSSGRVSSPNANVPVEGGEAAINVYANTDTSVWAKIAPVPETPQEKAAVWNIPIPDETVEVTPKVTVVEAPKKKGMSVTTLLMWVFLGYFAYDNYDRAQEYLSSQNFLPKIEKIVSSEPKETANAPDDLVKVNNIKNFYLQATRGDGQIELRTGGNITWRFNNPGRVKYGDYAKKMGAIGSNGEVSVFPNYEMGKKAVYELLFSADSEYSKRTIENSFVSNKLSYILKKSGLKKSDVLKDLNSSQQEALFKAVESAEGFTVGKITIFSNEEDFKKRGW